MPASPKPPDVDRTPSPLERLHMAARDGDLPGIAAAWNAGANLNGINNANGVSPLVRAARHGRVDAARHLLALGALPDHAERDRDQALHVAARQGKLDLVMLLVNAGARLDAQNRTRMTPLHEACGNGQDHVADWLLARGADVHAESEMGKMPLHRALARRDLGAVRILMQHGADPDRTPSAASGGLSPSAWARKKGLADLAVQMENITLRTVLTQALDELDVPRAAHSRPRL